MEELKNNNKQRIALLRKGPHLIMPVFPKGGVSDSCLHRLGDGYIWAV